MISVIIPVLNEERALPPTLDALSRQLGVSEVIIVDGGSTDATLAVCNRYRSRLPNLQLVAARRGRGSQLNAGAARARSEWLLFLHADTLLPDDGCQAIVRAARNPDVLSGCFKHRFSGRDWRLRLISWLNNYRFSKTHVAYGDQGMFIKRDLFRTLGGFPETQMEDILFGEKIVEVCTPLMLQQAVITDSRKFLQLGIWRALRYVLSIMVHHENQRPIPHQQFFANYR